MDPKTGELVDGGAREQATQCFTNIKTIVESIDHVMDDVVRITVFLENISDLDAVDEVQATFFPGYVPTRTTVAVSALPMDALVQVEALVSNGEGTIPEAPQAGDLVKVARRHGECTDESSVYADRRLLSLQQCLRPAADRSGSLVNW